MKNKIVLYLILICVSFLFVLPYFWTFSTALKPFSEVALLPPRWLPQYFTIHNFISVWKEVPFAQFYLNSIITSFIGCFFQIFFATLMAYAFVFIRFPYKKVLFFFVIATMFIPDEAKFIPNFILMQKFGWVNTYFGLIMPVIAHAFPVFVLTQWFRSLPKDLFNAAKVDGADHWQTLWQVMVPASRPVLLVLILFSFVNRWNDYLWPLVITDKMTMRTLPIGLTLFKSTQEGGNQWNLLMAASILASLPLLILFFIVQKLVYEEFFIKKINKYP